MVRSQVMGRFLALGEKEAIMMIIKTVIFIAIVIIIIFV